MGRWDLAEPYLHEHDDGDTRIILLQRLARTNADCAYRIREGGRGNLALAIEYQKASAVLYSVARVEYQCEY